MSYVSFRLAPSPKGQRTKRWNVLSEGSRRCLGDVRWYSPWRRYAFFPATACLFEQDCLRDIADFIELKTGEHKRERAARKKGQLIATAGERIERGDLVAIDPDDGLARRATP